MFLWPNPATYPISRTWLMGLYRTWTINLGSFLELTFAGSRSGRKGASRWKQVGTGAGAGSDLWAWVWLRGLKQEGEEPPGDAGNRRSSLNSKLLSVKFLAILCSWVTYQLKLNLINWIMWATQRIDTSLFLNSSMVYEFLFDELPCVIIPSVEGNRMLGFWHHQIIVTK